MFKLFSMAESVLVAAITLATISLGSMAFADGPDSDIPASPASIQAADLERAMFFSEGEPVYTQQETGRVLSQFEHLDPNHLVPTDLLSRAVLYFDKYKDRFTNQSYIVVVDFGAKSSAARFFIVNLVSGEVISHFVTHGLYSDRNDDKLAESFGNVVNSGKSSVGFYKTAEVYFGKFGRSLRIDGLSMTNSNVRRRAVVIHGWKKAFNEPIKQGLSWGCFAHDYAVSDSIIDLVKDGALMLAGVSRL